MLKQLLNPQKDGPFSFRAPSMAAMTSKSKLIGAQARLANS